MADEQKMRAEFDYWWNRHGRFNADLEDPDQIEAAWTGWQAAFSHASAAVKENLTVGEAVAWMTHHEPPMLFPTKEEAASYCDDDEQPIPLYPHPPRAAEDATGWREMDSVPADKAIMGAWFGSPDYTEISPVIYCSERGKWMNPSDMRDDEYTRPDMWHPYPRAPIHRDIDQAIAAKRGG